MIYRPTPVIPNFGSLPRSSSVAVSTSAIDPRRIPLRSLTTRSAPGIPIHATLPRSAPAAQGNLNEPLTDRN